MNLSDRSLSQKCVLTLAFSLISSLSLFSRDLLCMFKELFSFLTPRASLSLLCFCPCFLFPALFLKSFLYSVHVSGSLDQQTRIEYGCWWFSKASPRFRELESYQAFWQREYESVRNVLILLTVPGRYLEHPNAFNIYFNQTLYLRRCPLFFLTLSRMSKKRASPRTVKSPFFVFSFFHFWWLVLACATSFVSMASSSFHVAHYVVAASWIETVLRYRRVHWRLTKGSLMKIHLQIKNS